MQTILKLCYFFIFFILISCGEQKTKTAAGLDNGATSTADVTTTEQESKIILFFGNSLTAGMGLDPEEAFPALIQKKIDSLDLGFTIINAGLSGETTSNGLNRIDWVLKQPFDIFFLELGANDMLRGLDVDKTKENLEAIIMKVRIKYPNIPIVLAGMMAAPNMGKAYQKSFDSIYPNLAKKYDAVLIPFFLNGVAADKLLNLPDGKHPNAKGQKIVLENVWKALLQII